MAMCHSTTVANVTEAIKRTRPHTMRKRKLPLMPTDNGRKCESCCVCAPFVHANKSTDIIEDSRSTGDERLYRRLRENGSHRESALYIKRRKSRGNYSNSAQCVTVCRLAGRSEERARTRPHAGILFMMSVVIESVGLTRAHRHTHSFSFGVPLPTRTLSKDIERAVVDYERKWGASGAAQITCHKNVIMK